MGNLIRMDLYRIRKTRAFIACLVHCVFVRACNRTPWRNCWWT